MRHFFLYSVILSISVACGSSNSGQTESVNENEHSSVKIQYAENLKVFVDEEGYERMAIINPFNQRIEFSIRLDDTLEHRIICKSATINGMIAELDCREHLVGISKGSELFDSLLIQQYTNGQLQEFGDEQLFSFEKIIGSKANTLIYNGYNKDLEQADKLRAFSIELIPLYDWKEVHPLGKAEWIKLIGILCGKRAEAEKLFDAICNEYDRLSIETKSLDNKPVVLSGNITGDIWYAPMGDSYMAKLIDDAGGDYIYRKSSGTGSLELSMEQILKDNKATNIWINPGIPDKKQLLVMNPNARHLKAFDHVYCYSANMNKYWEQAALHPEKVLQDLITIFHPDPEKNGAFNFYNEVF